MPKHKSNIIPFRRIAAIAACLVLLFSFATSANAFCFRDVWNAVVIWAQETFSFSMGVEVSEPKPKDDVGYDSLSDAVSKLKFDIETPTYIPEGFALSDIIVDRMPKQVTILAIYLNEDDMIKISVQSFLEDHPEQIEMSDELIEIYTASGTEYYIFSNYIQTRIAWIDGSYECYISGNLSLEELKAMIDSIKKG